MPPPGLFISYAPKDDAFRLELEVHLAALEREGLITMSTVLGGADRNREINRHLDGPAVILLLISPDFLVSADYQDVIKPALQRPGANTAKILPVILRECGWRSEPVGRLTVLPSQGRSVASFERHDPAWQEVVEAIRDLVGA